MIDLLRAYIDKIKNHNVDLEPCCLNLLDEIIMGLNELIDGKEESK